MCQFARLYPLNVLRSFIEADSILSVPNIQNITNEVLKLNSGQFTQELTAQIQSADNQSLEITQEVPAQFQNVAKTVATIYKIKIEDIEDLFLASPIARINWASHMVILNNPLPLGYVPRHVFRRTLPDFSSGHTTSNTRCHDKN